MQALDLLSLLAAAADPRWVTPGAQRARHVPFAVALLHALRPRRWEAIPAGGEVHRACARAASALGLSNTDFEAVELVLSPSLAAIQRLALAPAAVLVCRDGIEDDEWRASGLHVAGERVYLRGDVPAALVPLLERAVEISRLLEALGERADLRIALATRGHDLAAARQRAAQLEESFGVRAVEGYRATRERWLPAGTVRRRAWSAGVGSVKGVVRTATRVMRGTPDVADAYARWIEAHEPSLEIDADAMLDPAFLVSVAVQGGTPEQLAMTRASLEAQVRGRWELCTGDSLAEALAGACGQLVIPLAPGDALAPRAVSALSRAAAETGADVVYGDEDLLDERGRRVAPRFKPDWSPELLLAFDYLGAPVAYRTELVRSVGPARDAWDLALRATA